MEARSNHVSNEICAEPCSIGGQLVETEGKLCIPFYSGLNANLTSYWPRRTSNTKDLLVL